MRFPVILILMPFQRHEVIHHETVTLAGKSGGFPGLGIIHIKQTTHPDLFVLLEIGNLLGCELFHAFDPPQEPDAPGGLGRRLPAVFIVALSRALSFI